MSQMKTGVNLFLRYFTFSGRIALVPLTWLSFSIQVIVSRLVQWYEVYFYSFLELCLSPKLAKIPRTIEIGNNKLALFSAANLIYFRTFLVIPIALSLKYNYSILACGFVLLNGFLDQIDLLLARVQKVRDDDQSDDPAFEEFLDSFCNKFISVLYLWTVLQEINLDNTSLFVGLVFVVICYIKIIIEIGLAIVSVQNYCYSLMSKTKKLVSPSKATSMETQLKDAIDSFGMGCFCLSLGCLEPFENSTGLLGMLSLFLTLRFGYHSIKQTTQSKKEAQTPKKRVTINAPVTIKTIAVFDGLSPPSSKQTRSRAMTVDGAVNKTGKRKVEFQTESMSSSDESVEDKLAAVDSQQVNFESNDRKSSTSSNEEVEVPTNVFQRSASLPSIWIDGRADKVYTVGCFDLFHDGHRILLQRMRQFGREVIVGVHDSRSIYKLKSRVPIDGTETRMLNVKRYADQVFCVAGTDPSNFITAIVHLNENQTAVYIRGDDMANFPSRNVVEQLMPVKFLPYTNGVSSTQLRKELFSHVQSDDVEHLEKIN